MVATAEHQLISDLGNPGRKRKVFDSIVKEYQQVLYYHIRRIVIDHDDANDVLQNTFLKAWRNIEKFRGDSSIKTWLYRIATNESITYLKAKKKRQFTDVEDIQNDLRHSLESGRYIEGSEIQLKLQRAILTLPERQRLVFNMRYFDEMKYDEMAQILELSTGSLKASYHHAVKKIEKYLEDQ